MEIRVFDTTMWWDFQAGADLLNADGFADEIVVAGTENFS
jgi:hypothetical protein